MEKMPLLEQRIAAMREVGHILCSRYGGSFQGFMDEFQSVHHANGTALQLVRMVVETFPCFRDEVLFSGEKVCFWKRAQILVAEIWAAFYPPIGTPTRHPFFPGGIGELTMFADYRVPQILHHLNILTYPPSAQAVLRSHTVLTTGAPLELSIRASSILAVEAIRDAIVQLTATENSVESQGGNSSIEGLSSVLIDFFLWDLAKEVEARDHAPPDDPLSGFATQEMLPTHRIRCVWY